MSGDNDYSFSSFGLSEAMLGALTRKGFTSPTSIQAIALPRLLADSGHLIVKARTGTGKTAAFGIPLVEKITQGGHAPRALILTPTRELALQVSREIASLVSGSFPRITAVYGGASIRNQILDLKRGTEIAVGTPGRVMDLMERKALELSAVDWFILDEADEMLDMGFFEDVEKILAAVKTERRIALFSATMPEAILKVIREYIGDVDILEDTAPEDEKPAVDQSYMILKREDRLDALRRLIDGAEEFYGLIFCATKAGADELARRLVEGGYPAEAIHGDLTQEARERTLRRFRAKQTTILAATDVAARGLDIERLTHVVNWDLPNDRETYIHRIGRTGRAGRRGRAISLALPAERGRMAQLSRSMERTLGSKISWMKVPSVKSVMKAIRARIVNSVTAVIPEKEIIAAPLPDGELPAVSAEPEIIAGETGLPASAESAETASPFLAKVCRQLIERIGADRAVEALITLAYGELLDPSRYGPVTEFPEEFFHEGGKERSRPLRGGSGFRNGPARPGAARSHAASRGRGYNRGTESEGPGDRTLSRVYVGLGRRHGAKIRDVAELLVRAGGVPGRMVDEIEMKDFCSFATLPADAARRAYAFSRNVPNDPVIRPASPTRER
ncbi:MAG: DEAD/DEAH box helicase [Treponema sp.]|jgi:ATP-dependent RNA helicase DeaD|nr:DEAD/DEAH box helicase [Treponema sp.]